MTEPHNEKIVEALERLTEGEVDSAAEKKGEKIGETGPALPAAFPGEEVEGVNLAGGIIEPDEGEEEMEGADEIVMTESPGEEGSVAAHKGIFTVRQNQKLLYKTMEFRQTIIPILLTCGVVTLGFSSLKFAAGRDSIFSDLPIWLPVSLAIAGIVLLFLAVLNMLAVKHSR